MGFFFLGGLGVFWVLRVFRVFKVFRVGRVLRALGAFRLGGLGGCFGDGLFETVVGFLQEGEVVVERLHVQRAVDVQLTAVGNGVT